MLTFDNVTDGIKISSKFKFEYKNKEYIEAFCKKKKFALENPFLKSSC
jgi:hypothetical protein